MDKHPLPVEHALVVASGTKSQQVEAQLRRLERLLPVLRRPSTRLVARWCSMATRRSS